MVAKKAAAQPQMNKDEQVGFHKILSIVEQLMQMHIKSLKELGIDLEAQAKAAASAAPKKKPTEKLDALLK
jgi:hypothetical protein